MQADVYSLSLGFSKLQYAIMPMVGFAVPDLKPTSRVDSCLYHGFQKLKVSAKIIVEYIDFSDRCQPNRDKNTTKGELTTTKGDLTTT